MTDVEILILRKLGYIPKELRISEKGHAARGTAKCHCNEESIITACSDVGGIWLKCQKCGFQDL